MTGGRLGRSGNHAALTTCNDRPEGVVRKHITSRVAFLGYNVINGALHTGSPISYLPLGATLELGVLVRYVD